MHNFSKRISIEAGFSLEFLFNRIYTADDIRYHVSVMDRNGNYYFTMEQSNGAWRIVNAPKVPDWIMGVEKKLENAIIENM